MNFDSGTTAGRQASSAQAGFRHPMEAWRHLLVQCGRKPGRKNVHALRVATLRLQAELEYGLRTEPANTPGLNAARRLRKQGKKLRRALGPVRQADVSLNKLARVRDWAGMEPNGHPACPAECANAIDRLALSFELKRNDAASKLTAEIKRRRKQLERLSKKAEVVFERISPPAESGVTEKIRDQIRAVADEFPRLDDGNLHAFRKRIKKIRYLAEIFGRTDEIAARQADALKRMTGAIGEWHDWQGLATEAGRAALENSETKVLADFLEARAGRSFESARQLCERLMRRLLREKAFSDRLDGAVPLTDAVQNTAEAGDHKPAARKPVASAAVEPQESEAERPVRA